MIVNVNHLLKQTKPGKHPGTLILKAYNCNKKLCIVTIFKEYLQRTKRLRADNKLLISTQKPHRAVTKATVSRWIRMFFQKAGVFRHYGPHSIRSAASSSARSRGIPIQNLLQTAGWSNVSTFSKFYDKEIELDRGPSIQMSILK